MTRPVYTFDYTDWFAVPDGRGCIDWDCDFYTLAVLPDGSVELERAVCQNDHDRIKAKWPNAEKLGSLSTHRNHLEECSDSDKLKAEKPEIYAILDKWGNFHDRRLKTA